MAGIIRSGFLIIVGTAFGVYLAQNYNGFFCKLTPCDMSNR
ncbi:hypothetical protein ACJIZ3_020504 [Penstemon smallii]|uniref:Uncharacterized protein n=1 Tax=Penstemon smallii TaxID=265156 RepID=A0ABD3SJ31_9LAMI